MSKSTVDTLNSHFVTIKNDYIDEVRNLINTSNISQGDKISTIIEKNGSHLLDKTNILLNDIIPKNNDDQQNRLKETIMLQMSELHKQICDDTTKMFDNSAWLFTLNFLLLIIVLYPA